MLLFCRYRQYFNKKLKLVILKEKKTTLDLNFSNAVGMHNHYLSTTLFPEQEKQKSVCKLLHLDDHYGS